MKKDLIEKHNELFRAEEENWNSVRSEDNFVLVPKEYRFGKRNTYVPKHNKNNELLQSSRGVSVSSQELSFTDDATFENYISSVENSLNVLDDADLLRISELKSFLIKEGIETKGKFCEIGFRIPKLLKYYKSIGYEVAGFDISSFNVSIAKFLDYDCEVMDLNDVTASSVKTEAYDLLVCYHVLEHTFDPLKSFSLLASTLKDNGILHIETPVEPGIPRLRYGHLIALEDGDLKKIVEISGLRVANYSTVAHPGGPRIERIIAIKESK